MGVPLGALRPDDLALYEIEDALRIAERSSDDTVVGYIQAALALALMHRQKAAERDRGQNLGAEVGEVLLSQGRNLCDLRIIEVYLARERARAGDRDDAVALMRSTVDHLFRTGRLLLWGVPATGVLVETLLDRCADGDSGADLAEAEAAIERLAEAPVSLSTDLITEREADNATDSGEALLIMGLLRKVTEDRYYNPSEIISATTEVSEILPSWFNPSWVGKTFKRLGFKDKAMARQRCRVPFNSSYHSGHGR